MTVPAAWHSPMEQGRKGSRTMQVSHRQIREKEKNNAAEKMREQCRRDNEMIGIFKKRIVENRTWEKTRKLRALIFIPFTISAISKITLLGK